MNISGLGQAIGQIQSSIQSSNTTSAVSPFSSPTPPSTGSGQESSFGAVLSGAIGEVESARSNAATSVEQFLGGKGDDLHTTILATQRAELEFEMFMQVRNKVVSAYQEIMKLQM